MPELPEVETVRRGLAPAMVGATIEAVEQRRPDLRFPLPENFGARLTGATILGLRRRAKYLIADLSTGEALVMHLGMTGRFLVIEPDAETWAETRPGRFHREPASPGGRSGHDHLVLHLSGGIAVVYNDVRRFGFMDLVPQDGIGENRHFAGLGLEPLGEDLTPEALARLFQGKRTPLKAALLDQRLIAGLGNIYVCEALFRARLDPRAPAGSLVTPTGRPRPKAKLLARIIREVLQEAVEAGGSTLRDYAKADGSLGYFQHRFQVYDRVGEACIRPGCTGRIARLVQSGRSTFYCPVCQGV